MACDAASCGVNSSRHRHHHLPPITIPLSSSAFSFTSRRVGFRSVHSPGLSANRRNKRKEKGVRVEVRFSAREPLKVMISGAPASGKGTQCELTVRKYGPVHVSTGDLLRAEVSSGTEIGNKAKEYMESGILVPDDVVTAIVKSRLSQQDARETGWLLDGYPRTSSQA